MLVYTFYCWQKTNLLILVKSVKPTGINHIGDSIIVMLLLKCSIMKARSYVIIWSQWQLAASIMLLSCKLVLSVVKCCTPCPKLPTPKTSNSEHTQNLCPLLSSLKTAALHSFSCSRTILLNHVSRPYSLSLALKFNVVYIDRVTY